MTKQKENLPADVTKQDSLGEMAKRLMNPAHLADIFQRSVRILHEQGAEQLWREADFRINLAMHHDKWQHRADIPTKRQLRQQRRHPIEGPFFSLVVPLYNTPILFLNQMIASVQKQTYSRWELVLVNASDDNHSDVGHTAASAAAYDKRIVLLNDVKNNGIADNTNIGFSACTGNWIALLDHDDLLYPNALYEAAEAIIKTGAEFVYTDEIVLSGDLKLLYGYHFKPDFAPDNLRGCNYITHLCLFSRELALRAGFEEKNEFDGAQDHDLILRLTECTKRIYHIPKVLYTWRGHEASTAAGINANTKPYAIEAGARAINAQLKRLGLPGTCSAIPNIPGAFRVVYELVGNPMISVLIPNKDHIDDLNRCLTSLERFAGYDNYEVIIIENNSTDPATFAFYDKLSQNHPQSRVVYYKGIFNFSAVNNFGARFAKGAHLLLLNNDIEIITPNFLKEMLSYSQRSDVACVGAKLFYPDGTIQHGGVIMGINGSAGHSHKGHPHDAVGDLYRLVTTQNFMAVTGACLMVKKSLYQECGGLDEQLFAIAYNDIDLCLKLWEKSYLNVYTPFAQGIHYESKSRGLDTTEENSARYEREKMNFYNLYHKYIDGCDPYYNPHFNKKFENFGLC